MNKGFLIIFPTESLLKHIQSLKLESSDIYVVLRDHETYDFSTNKNIYICDKIECAYLQNLHLKILCCHEEALYWLRIYQSNLWEYQFAPLYLDLFDKVKFKEKILSHGILIARYALSNDVFTSYPIIAKPSIGFGSIGVKLLLNRNDCINYLQNFDDMLGASAICKYQTKYFSGIKNICIFEDELDGDFYRTPFVVENEVCKEAFPVRGITKRRNLKTDYSWVEFEYSPKEDDVILKIKDILNIISQIFLLKDGTYVAEFIKSRQGAIYLLEFSPRITSDRISKLILYSTGVDLEAEAILRFFNMQRNEGNSTQNIVRLRIESPDNPFIALQNYKLISRNLERSVYGENVECNYYEKMEKYS